MISWRQPGIIQRKGSLYTAILLANILIMTALVMLGTMATIMGGSAIQGELALSDDEAAWLTTLNLLGINTVVPAASWLGDRFGYKTIYGIGIVLFIIASSLASVSVNFAMLGGARFLEGIGSGCIFPIGLTLITQNLPPKKLSLGLILYVCAVYGGGYAIGLPLSGFLTQFHTWRYLFLIIVAVGTLIFFSTWFVQEDTERKKTTPFDYLGFIGFALFIGFLLIALTYGPMLSTNEGWRSPLILYSFLISLVALIITIMVAIDHPSPTLPLVLFKHPIYAVTCVAMFLLGMSIYASVGTIMQYMMEGLQYERFVSGKLGIIYGVSVAAFSMIANLIIKKVPVPFVTGIGLFILVYSYFLNNILDWQTGPKQILSLLCLRGIGIGMSLGPATVQALESLPKELRSRGVAILTFFRQVGGTYGGTLIAMIIIKRKIFHVARFAEQTNTQLPGFQLAAKEITTHFNSSYFGKIAGAEQLAKTMIIQNIETQAYIQAINDGMILFGYITLAVTLLLAALSLRNWHKIRQELKKIPK